MILICNFLKSEIFFEPICFSKALALEGEILYPGIHPGAQLIGTLNIIICFLQRLEITELMTGETDSL